MMGPSLIFDKSTLQSLNPDESMWLSNFYLTNITPLFFVETLADLEKEMKSGKTPEQVVGSLAYKTPDMGACVNSHHHQLVQGELSGCCVEMSGRPVVSGGQTVLLGNEAGVIFKESPESEAFKRWQKYEFLDVERQIAKKWRAELKSVDLVDTSKMFQNFLSAVGVPKSLGDLNSKVALIIDGNEKESLTFCLSFMGISSEAQSEIMTRWENSGRKIIREFAPYFAHVMSVDLFFHFGLASNLFSEFRHPQTHNIDIAYLYYLPFCSVFVSNDKFHSGIVPFFLRPDQTFINGVEFKDDLKKLDTYYSHFPEETKSRGVVTFASIPPDDESFLVTKLWDKYMSPKWRSIKARKFDGTDVLDPEADKSALEKMRRFIKESIPVDQGVVGSFDEVNQVVMRQMVLKEKGKWRRFPPEIEGALPIFD